MLMFVAMNVGATAMVARYRGAGKPRQANEILRQALFLSLILSIIAGALGYVYAERLIAFMGAADPETLAGGTIYLRIQMLTLPIFALTATITAALRGVGHTRVAMVYNIVANVVNVTFNYLLIHGHLGFPVWKWQVPPWPHPSARWQPSSWPWRWCCGRSLSTPEAEDGFRPQWQHLYNIFNIGVLPCSSRRPCGPAPSSMCAPWPPGHPGLRHPPGGHEHPGPFFHDRTSICRFRHLPGGAELRQETSRHGPELQQPYPPAGVNHLAHLGCRLLVFGDKSSVSTPMSPRSSAKGPHFEAGGLGAARPVFPVHPGRGPAGAGIPGPPR